MTKNFLQSNIIGIINLLVMICGLVYGYATLAADVKRNTKDIENLTAVVLADHDILIVHTNKDKP